MVIGRDELRFCWICFEWTYAGLLAVEDGVADGRVGIAVAPLQARRGRARRARRRHPGTWTRRRELPQGPHLPVQRHQEPEVAQQDLPRRRTAAAPPQLFVGSSSGAPGAGARAQGRRRALGRVVRRRRGRRRRGFVLCSDEGTASGLAREEAAVADDLARADEHRRRGAVLVAGAWWWYAEVEVGGCPPHGEELGGVYVDEGPGAAEGISVDEALERRRRALEPPAGEAVAKVLRRGDLHYERRTACVLLLVISARVGCVVWCAGRGRR